jgi:hypothetical protein
MILILVVLICLTFLVSKSYLLTGLILGASIVSFFSRRNNEYPEVFIWSTTFAINLSIVSVIFKLLSWCAFKNQLIIIDIIISMLIASLIVCIPYCRSKAIRRLKVTVDREGKIIGYATFTKVNKEK